MVAPLAIDEAVGADGSRHVEIYSMEGLLTFHWAGDPAARDVVIAMGGAMGGVLGPAKRLYHELSVTLPDDGIDMNKSLTLKRRDDWWAKDNPAWQGIYNFDEYHFIVVQDNNLAFEKAKKGELAQAKEADAAYNKDLTELERRRQLELKQRKILPDEMAKLRLLSYR